MSIMVAGLVLIPLAAGLVIALAGSHAARWTGWVAAIATAASLVLAGIAFDSGAGPAARWFSVGALTAGLGLAADGLGSFMAVLVAGVCLVVQVYAVAYMRGDPRGHILFAWLSVFTGSMLALVLADSLMLLFIAWEFVSLSSYALIAFHHRDPEARSAAVRAFTVVRVGDVGLLLAIALLLVTVGDTSYIAVFAALDAGSIGAPVALLAGLGLVLAAIAKSAQLPLSAWLPSAMVAPTPVSALLHSATMVAAGVYLLVRFLPLLHAAPIALEVAVWVGAATALVGSLAATGAGDLKRVLAWSTVAHLGEMILIIGHSSPAAATFLLTTHALFKATLFLVAGAVQQRTGEIELGKLGGLWRRMPLAAAAFAVAALALVGIPPLGGFFSEEALLAESVRAGAGWAWFEVGLLFLAGVYIARVGATVFGSWPGAPSPEPSAMRPLAVGAFGLLALAAAVGGLARQPLESVFGVAALDTPPALLRLAAIAAALVGLGVGFSRVRRSGPVPALGAVFVGLARAADAALDRTGAAVVAAGRACLAVERILDQIARGTGAAGLSAASAARGIERGLDGVARGMGAAGLSTASAARELERGLDRISDRTGAAALASARAVVSVERDGFEAGGDGVAAGIDAAGGQLRRLHAGKLYLYTLSLFVSAVLLGALAVAIALV